MEKYVIKRNGDYKPFESFKIEDAIAKIEDKINKEVEKAAKRFENFDAAMFRSTNARVLEYQSKIDAINERFKNAMNDNNLAEVKQIIIDKLGVEESEVTAEASFTNDLGADSLDTVELIMEFEKEFNISIPDEQAETIATVGQAITYLEEHAA